MPPHSPAALANHVLRNVYIFEFGDSSLTFDTSNIAGSAKHHTSQTVAEGVECILGAYLDVPPPEEASPSAGPPSGAAGIPEAAREEGHGVLQHAPTVLCECGCPLKRLVEALREELRIYDERYRDSSGALVEGAPEIIALCSYFANDFTAGDEEPTLKNGQWATVKPLCHNLPERLLEPVYELCVLMHRCHYKYAIIGGFCQKLWRDQRDTL